MSADLRSLWLMLAGVGGLFIAMGGGLVVSVGAMIAILAYWLIGRLVLRLVVPGAHMDVIGMSASFVIVGIAVQVAMALLLQSVVPWRLSTTVLLGGTLVFSVWRAIRNPVTAIHRGGGSEDTWTSVTCVLGSSFLYLGRDYRWANVAFVGACLIIVAASNRKRRYLALSSALTGVTVIAFSLVSRPRYWWFVTNDHQWFEAIGITTVAFGPTDVLGANATLGYQYHFLTYAWTSGLGSVLGADEFVVLTRLAPVVCAVLVASVIWSLLGRLKMLALPVRFLTVCFLPLLFDYSYTSPSHVFGMAQLLALMNLMTVPVLKGRGAVAFAVGSLLGLSLSLTKVSAAPPAVLGSACVVLLALRRRDSDRRQRFWLGLGAVGAVGLHGLTLFLDPRTSRQANTSMVFGFARERAADLSQLGYGPSGIMASLLVTSAFILPPIVAVVLYHRPSLKTLDERVLWFALPSVPYVAVLAIASGNFSIGYFVTSGIYVLYVPMLYVVAFTLLSDSRTNRLLGFVTLAAATGFAIESLRPFVNGGTDREVLVRSVLHAYWIPALVIASSLAIVRIVRRRGAVHISSLLSSTVTLSVLIAVSITALNVDRLSKGPDLSDSESVIAVGRETQRAVGAWISDNTPADAVFASNHFCGAACTGSGWFVRDLSLMGEGFQLGRTATGYGGSDFFLVIYSGRRFLVQSPTYLLTAGVPQQVLAERVEASLRFAADPDPETLSRLRDFGVSHFVVDKRATSVRDYSGVGETISENEEFIVLRLAFERA